jgi:hypothetical protein
VLLSAPSRGISFCVRASQLQSYSRARQVRPQLALYKSRKSLGKHPFDANVIMKVLQISKGWNRATYVGMERRGGVAGEGQALCLTQHTHLQKSGHTTAARD